VLSLAELALVLALWQGPAWTATIPVDGVTCTLASAITAANTDAIAGGCPAGSGADTLVLPAGGTITLTAVDNTTDGPTGLPVVTSVITIAGQGSTLQRDASAPAFRLLAVGSGGDLTVQALTLQGGNSAGYGGGLGNRLGTVTIVNSTLSGNTATGDGGGVSNFNGSVTIVNSTLSANTAAGDGGGVSNHGGSVTITSSTLSGNSSSIGGGVFNNSTLTLSQSTLSGNTSNGTGGGVFNNNGTLTLARTLVSGNTAVGSGAEIYNFAGAGLITVDEFNLFGQNGISGVVDFAPGATDIVPPVGVYLSAILEPLAFNGGPTRTHNLASGSPALNAATSGGCPNVDQRGFVRPAGVACDIGAVELGASPPPEVTSPVSFGALPDTFSTTTDTTGCPGGAVGKFFLQAQLTNQAVGPSAPFLEALKAQVAELSGGNLLQTADEAPGGPGALQTLPEVEAFSDGVLEPAGTVTVPFVICLQSVTPFRFTVDLLGVELPPP